MDNLEKVKRHLAKPIPISLKTLEGEEDIFLFKPLNVEQQAILMELSRRVEKREKTKVNGKEVPDIKKDDMTEMFNLLVDITRSSITGLDEDTIKEFVNSNFEELSEKMVDLIPVSRNKEFIDNIKKKQGGEVNEPDTGNTK